MNFNINNIRLSLIALVFVFLLIIPIIENLTNFTGSYENTEARNLNELPSIKENSIRQFVSDFDDYYKDNFGTRQLLLESYRKFKFNSLKLSPFSDKVIIGKEGWMFLGNKNKRIIDRYRGIIKYSDNDLKTFAKNIRANKIWCDKSGIKYYLVVAPNKHEIYPEYLPDYANKVRKSSEIDDFNQYMATNISFTVIDVREKILDMKNQLPVYYKTDTHWNELGAFCAYMVISDSIKKDFPIINTKKLSDYIIDTIKTTGRDLARMINTTEEVEDIHISLIPKFKNTVIDSQDELLIPDYYILDPKQYEIRNKNSNKTLPKALIFRDSFCDHLLPFLREDFSETVFIWEHNFNKELILKEKPDIVIHEIIQRELDQLLSY